MSLALLGMLPEHHRDLVREGEKPRTPKPPKTHRILPAILQRSRDFRHRLTPTETKIWKAVRGRQLGFKVRRQHPIDGFIVAFYCAEANRVIEMDGDSHGPRDQVDCDLAKTRWLEERGCRVIRPAAAQDVEVDLAGLVEGKRRLCEEMMGAKGTA